MAKGIARLPQRALLDLILNQLASGKENLDVLDWAVANSISTVSVTGL
jgi:hypothetical protein